MLCTEKRLGGVECGFCRSAGIWSGILERPPVGGTIWLLCHGSTPRQGQEKVRSRQVKVEDWPKGIGKEEGLQRQRQRIVEEEAQQEQERMDMLHAFHHGDAMQ